MKNFLISILIIFGMFFLIKDDIVIPKESIRFRVIANSNSEYDQNIKMQVKDTVEKEIFTLLNNTSTLDMTRKLIKNNLNNIDTIVNNKLEENNYNHTYSINYGMNYFPEKIYKGVTYDSGEYESLVITLGDGKGDNWWCVLFPPFCLIEADESSEVEYKWMVKEILNKYF